jgi:anti-sigma factor RsiW
MSCNVPESRLHDYVDGLLDEGRRDELERHLDACAACRATLGELQSLLREVADLPRAVAPSRDLLPAIREGTAQGAASSGSPGWTRWAGVAAAIGLGIVLVVGGTRWLDPGEGEGGGVPGVAGGGAAVPATALDATAELVAAEEEYARAVQQLMSSLEKRRDQLSPTAAAALSKNLAIIDQAIDDIRKALEADPENQANSQLLATMHQQKVELLWRVLRLSS